MANIPSSADHPRTIRFRSMLSKRGVVERYQDKIQVAPGRQQPAPAAMACGHHASVASALFVPGERPKAIRANNAGTKVIYSTDDGHDETCWAQEWTDSPAEAARLVRARAEALP